MTYLFTVLYLLDLLVYVGRYTLFSSAVVALTLNFLDIRISISR